MGKGRVSNKLETLLSTSEGRAYFKKKYVEKEHMAKKIIPAVELYICDRCDKEFKAYEGDCGLHGKVEVWGRSYMGDIGGTTKSLDLCEDCYLAYEKFMEEKPTRVV